MYVVRWSFAFSWTSIFLFFRSVCYRNVIEAILALQWLLGYSTVDPDPMTLVTGVIVEFVDKTVSFAGELPKSNKKNNPPA